MEEGDQWLGTLETYLAVNPMEPPPGVQVTKYYGLEPSPSDIDTWVTAEILVGIPGISEVRKVRMKLAEYIRTPGAEDVLNKGEWESLLRRVNMSSREEAPKREWCEERKISWLSLLISCIHGVFHSRSCEALACY